MVRRTLFIVAPMPLLLMFCTRAQETVTTSTTSTQVTASTAPAPAASTQTVVTQTTTTQAPAPPASGGSSIASQETNWAGITAEVTEFRRKGNTLTAKVRFTNKGSGEPEVDVHYGEIYLIDTAGGKKYETLKDEKGAYIAALRTGW